MEQNLKKIISEYINVPVNEITHSTIIDRTTVSSSIVLHRMYARLADNGFKVDNYWDIKTLEDLLREKQGVELIDPIDSKTETIEDIDNYVSIGIDLEEISELPVVADYREDNFYKINFAPSEIAYCILQPDTRTSFAGLFAIKEAIIKANNSYKKKSFNTIIIEHLPNGKPFFKDFQLSISHTKDVTIGIAILMKERKLSNTTNTVTEQQGVSTKTYNSAFWLSLIAIISSMISLIILLRH